MIRFKTQRLTIRDVMPDDMSRLLTIYSNPETMRWVSNGKYDWSRKELEEKLNQTNRNYRFGFGLFVVIENNSGQLIGEASLFDSFNDHSTLELGYLVDKNWWRMGFGTEICQGLIQYAAQTLKTKKLIARMYAANVASIKVAEHCGMHLIKTGETENGAPFLVYETQ